MSQLERIAKLEREVQEMRSMLAQRDRGTHPYVNTRPAKVVTAATSGATFGIVFLDVEYEKTINSSVASFIPRQAAQAEFCQNICADGGNPPVNTRIEAFLWGGHWVTWWRPASTSTTEDKAFWYIGTPRWSLEDPTVEQTAVEDHSIRCGTASWGIDALTFVPLSSTVWSSTATIATYDDTETDFDTSGPIKILEDGRYQVFFSGSFGMIRSTGAAPEPAADKVIRADLVLRYEDTSLVRDLVIGSENIPQPGDSHFNWSSSGVPTGYETVSENSQEWAYDFNAHKTVRLYAGYWAAPVVRADGPDDYGLIFNGCTLVIRKLPD